jgi:hypothetical protein
MELLWAGTMTSTDQERNYNSITGASSDWNIFIKKIVCKITDLQWQVFKFHKNSNFVHSLYVKPKDRSILY